MLSTHRTIQNFVLSFLDSIINCFLLCCFLLDLNQSNILQIRVPDEPLILNQHLYILPVVHIYSRAAFFAEYSNVSNLCCKMDSLFPLYLNLEHLLYIYIYILISLTNISCSKISVLPSSQHLLTCSNLSSTLNLDISKLQLSHIYKSGKKSETALLDN